MNEEGKRFKYNMDFEHALSNLLGQKYYGMAGIFRSSKISKKFLLRAISRIRRRLNEIIVTDERLILTTSITLDRLEHNVKTMSAKVNNDWFIIANLLNLVALLIGYDWDDGKIHRSVFFYQDREQEIDDYHRKVGRPFWDEFRGDWRIRFEIVYLLKEMELPNNQIARVIGISDKLVTKILRRIKDFEKDTEKRFLEHSTELSTVFFIV